MNNEQQVIALLQKDLVKAQSARDNYHIQMLRYLDALLWALGEAGTFRFRGTGEGAYWWRKELGTRAGLATPDK